MQQSLTPKHDYSFGHFHYESQPNQCYKFILGLIHTLYTNIYIRIDTYIFPGKYGIHEVAPHHCFNIKMRSYQYRNSHNENRMVMRVFDFYNPYTWKDSAQIDKTLGLMLISLQSNIFKTNLCLIDIHQRVFAICVLILKPSPGYKNDRLCSSSFFLVAASVNGIK